MVGGTCFFCDRACKLEDMIELLEAPLQEKESEAIEQMIEVIEVLVEKIDIRRVDADFGVEFAATMVELLNAPESWTGPYVEAIDELIFTPTLERLLEAGDHKKLLEFIAIFNGAVGEAVNDRLTKELRLGTQLKSEKLDKEQKLDDILITATPERVTILGRQVKTKNRGRRYNQSIPTGIIAFDVTTHQFTDVIGSIQDTEYHPYDIVEPDYYERLGYAADYLEEIAPKWRQKAAKKVGKPMEDYPAHIGVVGVVIGMDPQDEETYKGWKEVMKMTGTGALHDIYAQGMLKCIQNARKVS